MTMPILIARCFSFGNRHENGIVENGTQSACSLRRLGIRRARHFPAKLGSSG